MKLILVLLLAFSLFLPEAYCVRPVRMPPPRREPPKQQPEAAPDDEIPLDEWKKIQHHIDERKVPDELGDYKEGYASFKVIGTGPKELPQFERLYLKGGASERENCIILYASYNLNYPQGIQRLVKTISDSDYKGHVYYRIGGWPNTANGGLDSIDIPYGFKLCAFKEVQKLGYKRVLWMDASIIPVAKLNSIFSNMIKKQGYFVQANTHTVGKYMNEKCANAFGLTKKDTDAMLSCSSAVIGIDFENEKGKEFFEAWDKISQNPDASLSGRPDQNLISILLHQLGMTNFAPARTLVAPRKVKWDTLFVIDRGFVKNE